MKRLVWLTIGAATLAAAGCHHYVPATLETVQDGSRIRAVLTPAAQERLRERYRVPAEPLDGTVQSQTGDQLIFYVPSESMDRAFGGQQLMYQQVEVRRGEILRVDIRRLDPLKTAALLGVLGATVTLVILESTTGIITGSDNTGGNGPVESIRGWLGGIPLVRW